MRRRSDRTLKSLHGLRSMRVLIVHPDDRDRQDLLAQVGRIGCRAEAVWPPPEHIAADIEFVFCLITQDPMTNAFIEVFYGCSRRPALIGIIESESPTHVQAVVHAGALAVITKPIRNVGLMTSMVLAHVIGARNKMAAERTAKLEQRMAGMKQFEQAKAILIARYGFGEPEAYEWIRARAMSKRISIDTVCLTVISAEKVFE
jgi:response regulator NasT